MTIVPGTARHSSQIVSIDAALAASSRLMSTLREISSARFLAASPVKITGTALAVR